MTVDHVVLVDREQAETPPRHVLVLHAHPPLAGEIPMVTLEASEHREDQTTSTNTNLATFAIDLDVLVNAVNTSFGEVVLLLDHTGIEALS